MRVFFGGIGMKRQALFGSGILLLASVIWGFAFASQSAASAFLAPFSVNALRFYIGGFTLIPMIFLLDRLRKSDRVFLSRRNRFFVDLTKTELLGGTVCGIALCAATVLQQYGLSSSETGAGNAAFITALYVVIVPIFARIMGQKQSIRLYIAALIAVLGFYLLTAGVSYSGGFFAFFTAIFHSSFSPAASDIYVLICAFIFSFHILFVDRISQRVDGVRVSVVQLFVAAVIATPFMLFEGLSPSSVAGALPHLLYLGCLSCGFAYTAQIVGQRYTKPATGAMILSLEAVFGALGGLLFLGESMTAHETVGALLVFFGVILSQIGGARAEQT